MWELSPPFCQFGAAGADSFSLCFGEFRNTHARTHGWWNFSWLNVSLRSTFSQLKIKTRHKRRVTYLPTHLYVTYIYIYLIWMAHKISLEIILSFTVHLVQRATGVHWLHQTKELLIKQCDSLKEYSPCSPRSRVEIWVGYTLESGTSY